MDEQSWTCPTCGAPAFYREELEDGSVRCVRCIEQQATRTAHRSLVTAPPPPEDVRAPEEHERREWEVTYVDTGDGHKRRRRFTRWPYAWRLAQRIEEAGTVSVHTRDGVTFRAAQLVGIDAVYLTASSVSGRVCACGCAEPLTTRHRADARYLNRTHKQRAVDRKRRASHG